MTTNTLTINPTASVSIFAYICSMEKRFEKYRGIHPGIILARELKKRDLAQRPIALSADLAPQSFNQIIKGKRSLPLPAALKIDRELGLEEGTLALLQTYYDIEKEKRKTATDDHPDMQLLRKSLFWDTNIDNIDWPAQYRAVILRVFERGNLSEKKEILRFYGSAKAREVLRDKSSVTVENATAAHPIKWNRTG